MITRYTAKKEFVLKEIAGDSVLMARGPAALEFGAVIVFNESGVFLWKALARPHSAEELAQLLHEQFDAPPEQARSDAEAFLKKMDEAGLLCQEQAPGGGR